ncbi:MAG: hypothetical protein P8X74_23205 [Reinekea sp.]|jgi:hypothetical protein
MELKSIESDPIDLNSSLCLLTLSRGMIMEKNNIRIKPTDLWQGINGVTGKLMPSNIVTGGVRSGDTSSKTDAFYSMSSEDLSSKVSAALSFELGIGPFSLDFSVSGQESFSSSVFTAYIVVAAFYQEGIKSEENPTIPDDKLPMNEKEARAFALKNGDSYVSAIKKGASYYGIFSFTFTSVEQKSEVEVKAGLDAIIKAVTIGAKIKGEIENFCQKFNATFTLYQQVLGPAGVVHPEIDEMWDFARNFPKLSEERGQFVVYDWDICALEKANFKLEDGPFKQVIDNRKNIEGKKKKLSVVVKHNADLKRLKDTYELYKSEKYPNGFYDEEVNKVLEIANGDTKYIQEIIRSFNEKPTEPIIIDDDFEAIKYGNAILQIEAKDGNKHGGDGGTTEENFNPLGLIYGGNEGFVRNHMTISGVCIKAESDDIPIFFGTLASLNISYKQDGKGNYACPGSPSAPFSQLTGRVTKLSGQSGKYVDKLVFHTVGQDIGTGGEGGSGFEYPITDDWFLLYLKGYHGKILDWFIPVVARFKETLWEK